MLVGFLGFDHEFTCSRKNKLSKKIDVITFTFRFTENYPQSAKIMKDNPDYQNRFKY